MNDIIDDLAKEITEYKMKLINSAITMLNNENVVFEYSKVMDLYHISILKEKINSKYLAYNWFSRDDLRLVLKYSNNEEANTKLMSLILGSNAD